MTKNKKVLMNPNLINTAWEETTGNEFLASFFSSFSNMVYQRVLVNEMEERD